MSTVNFWYNEQLMIHICIIVFREDWIKAIKSIALSLQVIENAQIDIDDLHNICDVRKKVVKHTV